jgi:hypothetical protein
MAGVTHAKVSAIPDSRDATIIRPSDWNAPHLSAPDTVLMNVFPRTDLNPFASNMFGKVHALIYDTRRATAFRYGFNLLVPGAATFVLFVSYFDVGLVEHFLNATGQTVAANTAGLKVSPWLVLPSDAIAQHIRFQMRFSGGNGIADPSFGTCWISFR